MHDMIVIGGGPAGLSAALNGAAEGLDTLLLEGSDRLGGQAGTTSLIENYMGFKDGVPGTALARKAIEQAKRLGADLRTDHRVTDTEYNEATGLWLTTTSRDDQALGKAVVIATGVDYKRLSVEQDPHQRVLYGAPASAHDECEGKPVVVIGGGNSAGQAAINLAKIGATVTLLVRRPLRATMSNYLIEKIALHRSITASLGDVLSIEPTTARYEKRDGDVSYANAFRVFAYIGMTPRTDFVQSCCRTVSPGFIHSDDQFRANDYGLFVAGDVRAGSFKRVAAAVGEGAITAASVWRYIANG